MDDAPPRVSDDARERLLDAFESLLAGRSPEDPVVAAAEPLVASLQGWRDPAPVGDWLRAAEATPDLLAVAVGEPPTAYARHRDGKWTVVERDTYGPTRARATSRDRVEASVEGATVRVDVVDALPTGVRSRFVAVE